MKFDVKIKNQGQIRRAFKMAPQLMTRELAKAIRDSTIWIGREAVKQVTSGPNRAIDTGRLRASIQGGTFHGGAVSRLESGTRILPMRGEVGPTVHYAIYVHEGTRYMRARPFMTRAIELSDRQVQKFFTEAVDNVFNTIARNTL